VKPPRLCAVLCCFLPLLARAVEPTPGAPSATDVSTALRRIAIDPAQIYRVREIQIFRGDIKIYLTEGLLAFATPVAGRPVAAVFTTAQTEGGDAEVLLLPPQRSERAAMAAFTKSPNLDEHFDSAVFFFSDDTAKELMAQIQARPIHTVAEALPEFAEAAGAVLRSVAGLDVRLAEAILDRHQPEHGFFYGMAIGRTLGNLEVVYEPDRVEPVVAGRIAAGTGAAPGESQQPSQTFQIWTSFRPRGARAFTQPTPRIRDYRLDTTIHPDLTLASTAQFEYQADSGDGRAIALELAARLRVTGASIDGSAVEVMQHETPAQGLPTGPVARGSASFLLVAPEALTPGPHHVEIRYQGSVIHQTSTGGYFVDERNSWYPFVDPTLATFDLTFHCPANLRLAATGELISDNVEKGIRTVHRKTAVPAAFAGFNLGEYTVSSTDSGPYRIEFFANTLTADRPSAGLPAQTAGILDYYSKRWLPLPIHSLAVSPIDGYFGQGFPGLIYLSSISYVREADRPAVLRNPRLDAFFSDMLLPHEIGHQWWGNIVTASDYRSAWMLEAMPNYAALEFLQESKGAGVRDAILSSYRQDLTQDSIREPATGDKVLRSESAGPVDFGERLLNNSGMAAWLLVVYEKGTWILHMLRERLGEEGFKTLQLHLLQRYATKPVSNEDLRLLAAELVPANQPDRTLSLFFDTWVYGTGIPKLKLRRQPGGMILTMGGVEDDFSVDVPLRCETAGKGKTVWIRASLGENPLELPPGTRSCELPAATDFLFARAQ
jgi:Peptidase family M1 domain